MNDWPNEQETLARFRRWLAEARAESEAAGDNGQLVEPGAPAVEFGWLEVIAEFAALRHEVKLQTKSGRAVEEEAARAVAALNEAAAQFRSVVPKEAEAAQRAARPLGEALVDLHEALARGAAALEAARQRCADEWAAGLDELDRRFRQLPWWRRRMARRWHETLLAAWRERSPAGQASFFDALAEGYELVRLRLERTMKAEEICRIACLGRPFDPNTMTVVELADAPNVPPGTVVDEVRPGYVWRDKVVRFAEVRTTRLASGGTS
jgi:molecular chaperone GrpE